MAELGEISIAINQIEIKKQNLHQSFLHLQSQQSQSPSPLNSTLNWTEIDSYFTTLTSPILHKFHLLKTLIPPPPSSTIQSQLNSFCHNSDALGLRTFIVDSRNRNSITALLPEAYRCSPDPAAMVLDAMEGFFGGIGAEWRLVKGGCLVMLEGLMQLKPEARVRVEVRDRALKMAVELNLERVIRSYVREKTLITFGFLRLVDAYGLMDEFTLDEIMDCFVYVAKHPEAAIDLCRRMLPANKITDLIQELINKNMQVAAVKFIIEFKKTNEFSPVDLLEERKLMSMRILENIPKNGTKKENAIIMKEIFKLGSIVRCIDAYHLELTNLKHEVVALIKKVENEAGCKKRPPIEHQQQHLVSKKAKGNNSLEAADESDENSERPH